MPSVDDAPLSTPRFKPGRPRNVDLTRRLLRHAGDLVIAHGIDAVSPEGLARATGAGKASIYRRWPGGMTDLMVELVTGSRVVPLPQPGSPAKSQILALLASWSDPPTRHEQILANALGAMNDRQLRQCLRTRIDGDLKSWWRPLRHPEHERSDDGQVVVLLLLRSMLISRLQVGPLDAAMLAYLERQLLADISPR